MVIGGGAVLTVQAGLEKVEACFWVKTVFFS